MSTHPDLSSRSLAPPLSSVLHVATQVVADVLEGRSLTDALAEVPVGLRPATQAISYHAMRQLGWADALGRTLVQRYPSVSFEALLLVALTLLKQTDSPALSVPGMPVYAAHTVVDQAVTAAAQDRALASYKGLLNACLRRFLRERVQLEARVAERPEVQWNYPGWWVQHLKRAYPETWQAILTVANEPAPLTLRINQRRADRAQVQAAFLAAGIDTRPIGQMGLVLATPRPVAQLPGYAEGWWSVQDAGAQLAAELLAPRDGMRVLDACAAPGGKAAHLLELAEIDLLALDADAGRLARVEQNMTRLGLNSERVHLCAADAADLEAWWDGQCFDAVLADVPCTASGIVRRHPDIRWLRREKDLSRTAALQVRILDALWRTVAPGGRLLYVTCSVFPIEGVQQADAFLRRHADAARLEAPGQVLPVVFDTTLGGAHDGFFYALFAKRP